MKISFSELEKLVESDPLQRDVRSGVVAPDEGFGVGVACPGAPLQGAGVGTQPRQRGIVG